MKEDQLLEGEGHVLFTLKNVLILLIGFVLGYLIKGQAVQNITMGYDDYKIIVNEKSVVKNNEAQVDTPDENKTTKEETNKEEK